MNTKPAIASCLALFMLSTTTTAAQAVAYWTPWVSEDNNGPWVFCGAANEAVSGFDCTDALCGSVRARCETMPFSTSMRSYTYSDWFSEEDIGLGQWAAHGWYGFDDSYTHVCRWNGAPALMTGIHCQGLHCNNIQIECGAPANPSAGQWDPAELYDCHWTGYYSNENPAYAPSVGPIVTSPACGAMALIATTRAFIPVAWCLPHTPAAALVGARRRAVAGATTSARISVIAARTTNRCARSRRPLKMSNTLLRTPVALLSASAASLLFIAQPGTALADEPAAPAAAAPAAQAGASAGSPLSVPMSSKGAERLPDDGGSPPPGYVRVSSRLVPVAVTGGITLAVAHGFSTFSALFLGTCRGDSCGPLWTHGGEAIFVPVVGPFIALGMADPKPNTLGSAIHASLGVAQLAGAGMLLAGVLMEDSAFVRQEPPAVSVTPLLAPGRQGMQLGVQLDARF